jgi:hypothetical protein
MTVTVAIYLGRQCKIRQEFPASHVVMRGPDSTRLCVKRTRRTVYVLPGPWWDNAIAAQRNSNNGSRGGGIGRKWGREGRTWRAISGPQNAKLSPK